MKKANRTRGRGMQLSKERIEKDLIKLKKRMNNLYVEVMARERALELFTVREDGRTLEEAVTQEESLFHTEAVKEIESTSDVMDIRVGRSYENEAINKNGDLPGYEEAYKHLNELARERFNKNIKYVPNEEVK